MGDLRVLPRCVRALRITDREGRANTTIASTMMRTSAATGPPRAERAWSGRRGTGPRLPQRTALGPVAGRHRRIRASTDAAVAFGAIASVPRVSRVCSLWTRTTRPPAQDRFPPRFYIRGKRQRPVRYRLPCGWALPVSVVARSLGCCLSELGPVSRAWAVNDCARWLAGRLRGCPGLSGSANWRSVR